MDERPVYRRPDWFTSHVFNPAVAVLTRAGVSVLGSRVLRVRGRTSGIWRETPVNLLTMDGLHFLVAPRGETQWVRNLRASGGGELRVGRRTTPFTAEEIADDDKAAVLRAYLKRWRWEVGMFFGGVGPKSTDGELPAEGRQHPVFRGCPERLTAPLTPTPGLRPQPRGQRGRRGRADSAAGRLSGRVQVVGRRLADGQLRAGSRHRAGPRARHRGGLVAVLVEQRLLHEPLGMQRRQVEIADLRSQLGLELVGEADGHLAQFPDHPTGVCGHLGKPLRAEYDQSDSEQSRDLAPAQVVEHNPSGPAPAVGSGPNRCCPRRRSVRAAPPARGATPIAAAAAFERWLWTRRVVASRGPAPPGRAGATCTAESRRAALDTPAAPSVSTN